MPNPPSASGAFFFAAPVLGVVDIVELSLVILVFLGIPLAFEGGDHVTVDVLAGVVSPRVWRILGGVGLLAFGGLMTAMLFFVLIGAFMFARFVVLTRLPVTLTETVVAWELPTLANMLLMVLFYILLGCFLETVSTILITIAGLLPLVQELGFDAV